MGLTPHCLPLWPVMSRLPPFPTHRSRARPTDPPPVAQPAVTIYKDRKQIVHQTKIQEVAATLKCNECRFTSTDPIAFARHAHSHVKEKVVEKERIVEVPGPERVVEKEVVKVVKELV